MVNKNRSNGRRYFGNNRHSSSFVNYNTVFDSSSALGHLRGTAQQLADKFLSASKDARSQNDRVLMETYLQQAEHYTRILETIAAQDTNRTRQAEASIKQVSSTQQESAPISTDSVATSSNSTPVPEPQTKPIDNSTLVSSEKQSGSNESSQKAPKRVVVRRRVQRHTKATALPQTDSNPQTAVEEK